MTQIASPGQLRMSFLRWALVLAPGVLLLGFLSGALSGSGPGNPWFDMLAKPRLYPPPQTFAIVWPVLYLLMGLALAMIVTARGAAGRGAALGAFAVQLALNLAWSPVFFAGHTISGALWLLVALDVAVLVTAALFWRVRPLAGVLLLPYLAWIAFATVLTMQLDQLNPGGSAPRSGAATRIEL